MILAEYLYLMITVPEVIWFDRTDGANAKNGGGENSEIVMKPNKTDVTVMSKMKMKGFFVLKLESKLFQNR